MNLSKLNIIIAREYLNKVKKKSFLIITFVAPILFAGVCVLPSLIVSGAKEEAKQVAVVDYTGCLDSLQGHDRLSYQYLGPAEIGLDGLDFQHPDPDSLRAVFSRTGTDAILAVKDTAGLVLAAAYSEKDLGMENSMKLKNDISAAVEARRQRNYQDSTGVNLDAIMETIHCEAQLLPLKISEDGSVAVSESGVLSVLSMVLGLALYMFIMMFCGMVMSSVIEEKSSRVVEVLISSVKATELMFGKIIGVALVAMTQFLLWILLTVGILAVVGSFVGFDTLFGSAAASVDPSGMTDMSAIATIFSTLGQLNYGSLLICFVLYFVFGYLLYASLYAAIGSAVETEADTQQLQIPITIPLMIGMFISIYTMKAPESGVVFWGSMIPFTSPVVMLSRIPFDPPVWEIVLSLGILVATFFLMAWFSAKIYKVGILMFGKKSTFKDLWKWFKQGD